MPAMMFPDAPSFTPAPDSLAAAGLDEAHELSRLLDVLAYFEREGVLQPADAERARELLLRH